MRRKALSTAIREYERPLRFQGRRAGGGAGGLRIILKIRGQFTLKYRLGPGQDVLCRRRTSAAACIFSPNEIRQQRASPGRVEDTVTLNKIH